MGPGSVPDPGAAAMQARRIVLGIGNPGADYDGTRHNVGFLVADLVARRFDLAFRRLDRRSLGLGGKVKAQIATGVNTAEEPFALVKPLTYVNLSGDVAGPLLRLCELPPASLFVLVDDLNLPLGRIRVRPAGSAGGHNGLRSIESALGCQAYPRLRLGIGQAEASTTVEHVLGPFTPQEREVVEPVLERAADGVVAWLNGTPIEQLMGRLNGPGSVGLEEDV